MLSPMTALRSTPVPSSRCLPGWTGEACERPACAGSPPCNGRAPCLVDTLHRTATCACEPPYSGDACELAVCPGDCSGHGKCTQPPSRGAGQCTCDSGWQGADCSHRVCAGGCSGNGECSKDGRCVCSPGWDGTNCAQPTCPGAYALLPDVIAPTAHPASTALASAPSAPFSVASALSPQGCGEHGTCNLKTRACECEAGWGGADCSHRVCPSNCHGRGSCLDGVCHCPPFYAGAACERKLACASGCNGHGTCDDGGACKCEPGWSGADCEHRTCVGTPLAPGLTAPPACHGRGKCIDGACECDAPLSTHPHLARTLEEGLPGDNSSSRGGGASGGGASGGGASGGGASGGGAGSGPTSSSVCRAELKCMHGCNDHGSCDSSRGVCECDLGWHGAWCQHKECAHGCGSQGWCSHGDCICDAGWTGERCELIRCLGAGPLGCGAHGECIQPTGSEVFPACVCHAGWAGADCSVPDPHQTAEMYEPAAPPPPPWYKTAKREAPRRWE